MSKQEKWVLVLITLVCLIFMATFIQARNNQCTTNETFQFLLRIYACF
jgi:hypothetical protein